MKFSLVDHVNKLKHHLGKFLWSERQLIAITFNFMSHVVSNFVDRSNQIFGVPKLTYFKAGGEEILKLVMDENSAQLAQVPSF